MYGEDILYLKNKILNENINLENKIKELNF